MVNYSSHDLNRACKASCCSHIAFERIAAPGLHTVAHESPDRSLSWQLSKQHGESKLRRAATLPKPLLAAMNGQGLIRPSQELLAQKSCPCQKAALPLAHCTTKPCLQRVKAVKVITSLHSLWCCICMHTQASAISTTFQMAAFCWFPLNVDKCCKS